MTLEEAIYRFDTGDYDSKAPGVATETMNTLIDAAKKYAALPVVPLVKSPTKFCDTCGNTGWLVHPENGLRVGVRCPMGCRSNCSVCSRHECDNPGGQH